MHRWAIIVVAISAVACGRFSALDVDTEHQLEAKKIHEECFRLDRGDVVRFDFESSAVLDFNLHYHVAKQVFYPVRVPSTKGYSASFAATSPQNYCLMWTNRQGGRVTIRYRAWR